MSIARCRAWAWRWVIKARTSVPLLRPSRRTGRTTRTDVAAPERNPRTQVTIERLIPLHIGPFDVPFTNSAAYMVAAVLIVTAFILLTTRQARLVPDRWQSVTELSYEFIANMIEENAGHGGERYFPFLFSLFMFILLGNLLGMIPYTFTHTHPIIITSALAPLVFI